MIFRLLLVFCITAALSPEASPQTHKAKSSSRPKPVVESSAPNANLQDRYEALSCSLVRITSNQSSGTGFFISDNGTVATAAHVVFQTTFSLQGSIVQVSLTPQADLKLTTTYGVVRPLTPTTTADDKAMAAADLAIVKTNLTPRCHLEIGDSKSLRIGAGCPTQAGFAWVGFPFIHVPNLGRYSPNTKRPNWSPNRSTSSGSFTSRKRFASSKKALSFSSRARIPCSMSSSRTRLSLRRRCFDIGLHLFCDLGEYYHLVTLWKATKEEQQLYEEYS